MTSLEGIFLWTAVFFYGASFFVFLSAVVFTSSGLSSLAWKGSVAGFILHTAAITVRWITSGHPPVLGTFEHALAGSWFVMTIFLIAVRRFSGLKDIGVIVSLFVLLMLGYGVMSSEASLEPLPPPYRSNWLWVHVTFAWIAYGAYHVAAGIAILYLLKERKAKGGKEGRLTGFLSRLPETSRMDEFNSKLIVYGFIAHIGMLGSGAIWAYGLWGRYWAWDPIEIWSLVTWLIYGMSIHLRTTYGWRGRKYAWLVILSLIGIIVTFGGIGFIGGVHTPLL
jgi:cytochrome c-type biogenesis protein CcsB